MIRKLIRKISNAKKSPKEIELENLKKRGLKIGKKVDIYTDYPFDSLYPGLISVGDYVTISSNVKILAHDASMGYLNGGVTKIGIVDIGNHVFIGYGSIILCNVRIGDYAVIGAGSVVTKDIPPYCVASGNPARVIGTTEDFKAKHEEGLRTHHVSHKPWHEWANATPSEWDELRDACAETYAYITCREDV